VTKFRQQLFRLLSILHSQDTRGRPPAAAAAAAAAAPTCTVAAIAAIAAIAATAAATCCYVGLAGIQELCQKSQLIC
jgi:hypothetical protein